MDLSVGGEFFSGRRVLGVTEHCCQGAAPVHGQTLRIIVWTSSSSLSSCSPSSSSSRSSSYNGVASLARAQWSDCGLMSGHYTQPAPHNCCTTSIFFSTRCRWWGYTIIQYTQPATTPLYTTNLAQPPSFQQNGEDYVIMKNVNWEKEEHQDNHGDANNIWRKYFFSRVSWQGKR